jgi:hypothetical protein
MTIPRPIISLNFAETPGIIDPRATFTRATTGAAMDRLGVQRTVPAGSARWRYHPINGTPQGMMFEPQRTNLALRSEELDNASWTKTSATIGANAIAAPDGATTADSITVSGASGSANQAVTITAGNFISASVFFKSFASSHGRLRITDGTNSVNAWFNLGAGAVGTASAGAATCIYSNHYMEALPNGWYRCTLVVSTATSTAFTIHVSCAASDNVEPASPNSVYAWGAQIEQTSSSGASTTYIATTSAAVTRNGDALMIPVGSSWFNTAEGTMLFEWVGRPRTSLGVYGGIGNTFSDTVYMQNTATQLSMVVLTGGATQAQINITHANAEGVIYKAAMAWASNDFAFCVGGVTPSTDTSGTVPPGIVRIGIANAPWQASGGTQAGHPFRRAAYWPRRLSNAALQTLTQ